jgi:hypothetical protein
MAITCAENNTLGICCDLVANAGNALKRIRKGRSANQIEAELRSILRATAAMSSSSGNSRNERTTSINNVATPLGSAASPSPNSVHRQSSSWSWIKPLLIGCAVQAFQVFSIRFME